MSSKSIEPITLANSLPSLLIKIVVGTPLRENVFANVVGGSKYGWKFLILRSRKNLLTLSKFSFPI